MSEEKKEELNEEQLNQEEQTQEESESCEDKECSKEAEEQGEQTLEEKVQELEAKLKESEDKYFRVHADFENIKKRLEKEKYQAIDYASEKFAKDLLTTMDTLEMALQSANGESDPSELIEKMKEGIELTIKNMVTTFEKHDITVVDTDEFDPQVHNAVMQVDSDEKESGQIVQVMQKGYMYKERLLRPAMVSIAN